MRSTSPRFLDGAGWPAAAAEQESFTQAPRSNLHNSSTSQPTFLVDIFNDESIDFVPNRVIQSEYQKL